MDTLTAAPALPTFTPADDTAPAVTGRKRPDGDRTPTARERDVSRRCARYAKRGHNHTRSGRRAAND